MIEFFGNNFWWIVHCSNFERVYNEKQQAAQTPALAPLTMNKSKKGEKTQNSYHSGKQSARVTKASLCRYRTHFTMHVILNFFIKKPV